MEALIIDGLDRKGPLSERKLWKRILRHFELDERDESEEVVKLRGDFDKVLQGLLGSHKVISQSGQFSINKVAVTKRQRIEESQAAAQVSKKIKLDDQAETADDAASSSKWNYPELWKNGERFWREGTFDPEYLRTNPEGITRLFCGNLNRNITEDELKNYLPGIVYIKWITDKETGAFYGSSFLEMKDATSAAMAVLQDKTKFMGRPLKIYYCPPRPGDQWPPKEHGGHNGGKTAGKSANTANGGNNPNLKPKTEKPEGAKKLFMGNLSYDIDDDNILQFFKDCGTPVGLRWLTRADTGEFRGSGYVEFATPAEAEKAMLLDGMELLGRKIRLDWTI